MSDVDQQFLNLNIWNLKEITKLADKIMKQYGDAKCQSWRYPIRKSSELNVAKILQSDNYTQILELTIDRTIYVLNLMIKYLENLEGMDNPQRNVERPDNLSLAAILNILWGRVEKFVLTPIFKRNLENIEVSMKTSRLIQTEICKFSKCNSCDLVQMFVTYLVAEIETISADSAVAKERKHLKNFLEDSTNWSVMSKWLNAITKDIKDIIKESERTKSENENLKITLAESKETTEVLEERIKEGEAKILTMEKQIEDLIDENNQDFERAETKMLQLKNEIITLKQKEG